MVSSNPTMTEALESHVRSIMGQIDSLHAIIITDR
jgi:hypothetical protein